MKCPKCKAKSGDDWTQCGGSCPMPMSPHYKTKVQLDKHRYFLSYLGMEKEVTKQEYMEAERKAGFRSKFPGEPATSSFGSSEGVNGRIEYVK